MAYLIKQTDKGAEVLAHGSKNDCEREGARVWAAGETAHLVVVLETAITYGGDYQQKVARRRKSAERQASRTREEVNANTLAQAAGNSRSAAEAARKEADRLEAEALKAEADAAGAQAKADKAPASKPAATKKSARKKAVNS